tara:strand:- start:530 stop:1531 length:1002 start_codon:yes stop_codon:yes gene_type:complete
MPLDPKDGIGSYIKDFKKSKAPQFKGKSNKKKRNMAIAAYLDAKRGPQESTFAGSNLKLFGQLNRDRSIPELSMKKRIKAKVQRGLVGPSTKKKPLMFRTMGKDAKDMQKKADVITVTKKAPDTKMALAKRALNKEGVIPNYADKMKNKNINKSDKDKLLKMRQMLDKEKPIKKEDTSFKVSIDGLPDIYMNDKTPGALLQKLRKIVKQPSLIKDVDRTTKNKVKKAYRDKAQGREVKEYKYDYGTPESVKLMKKVTPGQKEATDAPKGPESYESQYKRRLVKTTDPEHKEKGFKYRIKGKKDSSLTKKLYKTKPGQGEFNAQMKRIAGHEFG